MKRWSTIAVVVCAIGGALAIGYASRAADSNHAGASLQRLQLDADDLAEVTGLNVYKFETSLPKGRRFEVVLREIAAANDSPHVLSRHQFQSMSDDPQDVRVAFLRLDRQLKSALLGQDSEAEFRLDLPGCSPRGIATIVPVPLARIPGTQKAVSAYRSADHQENLGLSETALLSILAYEAGKAPSATSYPRAELVIQPVAD